ncbi:MAG: YbjN domain-containing protein, partial [Myxococcota bacterium]|nr:YbjN domain-containing protein [Myxococcota bacterium]
SPDGVAVRLQLAPDAWSRLLAHQLFGSHPAILPPETDAIDGARPVVVVLDMHPALVKELCAGPDPDRRLAQALRTSGGSALQTEHWRLRTATQPLLPPSDSLTGAVEVETGFTTAYGTAPAADPTALRLDAAVADAMRLHGLTPIPFRDTALRARVEDASGSWTMVAMMDPDVGLCTIYSAFPRPLDPALRPQAVDVLAQLNSQLNIGALELDEDGQLRVRTGVDLGGPPRDTGPLAATIGHNLALMREVWSTFAALAPG